MSYEIPVWIWMNAVVLLTAAAYVIGRLTAEASAGKPLATPAE